MDGNKISNLFNFLINNRIPDNYEIITQLLSNGSIIKDVLILAGDITDNRRLLIESFKFKAFSRKFHLVVFVPGNHDLWDIRNKEKDSFECFYSIMKIANDYGILTKSVNFNSCSIIPLFSWYDYTFGKPSADLYYQWADYKACSWPINIKEDDIIKYFLEINNDSLKIKNTNIITFSHFLPRIDLMPGFIPFDRMILYPVFGKIYLEEQIRILNPMIHIYGNSYFNVTKNIDNIKYINNAFGYPYETIITRSSTVFLRYKYD